MKRDKQKSAVYDWERTAIAPRNTTLVPFTQIESIVQWVWKEENLEHPPLVKKLHKNNKNWGEANRLHCCFGDDAYTWVILHELAHSMTSTCDGFSNRHGALFMGIYCRLLSKYLRLDFNPVESAVAWGLRVKDDALPVFG